MSRRLPDGRWVHRVRRANARWDAAWRRQAIRSREIVPCVEVEIAPAQPDDRGPIVDVVIVPKSDGGDQ